MNISARKLVGPLVAVSFALGCSQAHSPADGGTDAASGLPATAYVGRDCAPDDGAAVSVLVYTSPVPDCSADPEQRSLRITVYDGADSVLPISAPHTITSTATRATGSVIDCPGGRAPCRTSSAFTITFDTYAEGAGATGTYTATFAEGPPATGRFEATWCEVAPPMCG